MKKRAKNRYINQSIQYSGVSSKGNNELDFSAFNNDELSNSMIQALQYNSNEKINSVLSKQIDPKLLSTVSNFSMNKDLMNIDSRHDSDRID